MNAGNEQSKGLTSRHFKQFNWVGLWTLYLKEVRRFMKVWTQTVIAPMFTTLLFMAVFSLALGGSSRAPEGVSFVSFLAPGLLMMAVMQNAFANTLSSILIAKVQGNIVDVLMPPLSPGELTFAYVMGGISRGVVCGMSVFLAFFLWPGIEVTIAHWWAFLYFLVSGAAMLSLAGTLAGIWAEKFDHGAAITNFVIVPLTLLSGTFYSIDRLPETVQQISFFNPFFYLIDGFRYSLIDRLDGDLMFGVWFTLGLNLTLWVLVYKIFKSGYKLKP